MKRIIKFTLLIFVLIFLCSNLALADGVIIPPPDRNITEAGQKAIIFYDEGKEDLILSIAFTGDISNFGWLIPVPEKPEVNRSSDKAFEKLEELTLPKKNLLEKIKDWSFGNLGRGYFRDGLSEGLTPQKITKEPVSVLETKKVGVFDIAVLLATDSGALSEWLSKNNYNLPQGAESLLEDYIENKWYFVAAKINPFAFSIFELPGLNTGHATPVKISFRTKNLVYPLKISSLNKSTELNKDKPYLWPFNKKQEKKQVPYYRQKASILLYIFADHKKIPANYSLAVDNKSGSFTIDYADKISAKEIEELTVTETGDPWMKPAHDFYLTKLSSHIKPADMTEDLFFKNASDNYSHNAGHLRLYQWFLVPLWLVWFGLVTNPQAWIILGVLFFILVIPQLLLRSRPVWVICWIFQFFALFLISGFFFIMTGALLISVVSFSMFVVSLLSWFFTFIIIAVMYLIIILQFRKHHLWRIESLKKAKLKRKNK